MSNSEITSRSGHERIYKRTSWLPLSSQLVPYSFKCPSSLVQTLLLLANRPPTFSLHRFPILAIFPRNQKFASSCPISVVVFILCGLWISPTKEGEWSLKMDTTPAACLGRGNAPVQLLLPVARLGRRLRLVLQPRTTFLILSLTTVRSLSLFHPLHPRQRRQWCAQCHPYHHPNCRWSRVQITSSVHSRSH
jgi:hypothetical protein